MLWFCARKHVNLKIFFLTSSPNGALISAKFVLINLKFSNHPGKPAAKSLSFLAVLPAQLKPSVLCYFTRRKSWLSCPKKCMDLTDFTHWESRIPRKNIRINILIFSRLSKLVVCCRTSVGRQVSSFKSSNKAIHWFQCWHFLFLDNDKEAKHDNCKLKQFCYIFLQQIFRRHSSRQVLPIHQARGPTTATKWMFLMFMM